MLLKFILKQEFSIPIYTGKLEKSGKLIFFFLFQKKNKIKFFSLFKKIIFIFLIFFSLDIIKTEWTPSWTIESLCRAVLSIMSQPNPDSPLNCDCGTIYNKCNKFENVFIDK
jgi:hypothetical protein